MKEEEFISDRECFWDLYEVGLRKQDKTGGKDFIRDLRVIARDLEICRQRFYSSALIERLNDDLVQGYQILARHGNSENSLRRWLKMLFVEFPRTLRSEWRLFLVNSALFWGPLLIFVVLGAQIMEWIEAILGMEQMKQLEAMYGPEKLARDGFDDNFQMFAHYIMNNVSIDFRIIGSGLIGGVGALFATLFNGVFIGAAAGYCTHSPDCVAQNFWSFVVGHSAPELMGMLIVSTASTRIGLSWLMPGGKLRGQALREAGRQMLPLLWVGCLMTAFAAIIEGFWSAQPWPVSLKYFFGAIMWAIILGWMFLGGKESKR